MAQPNKTFLELLIAMSKQDDAAYRLALQTLILLPIPVANAEVGNEFSDEDGKTLKQFLDRLAEESEPSTH